MTAMGPMSRALAAAFKAAKSAPADTAAVALARRYGQLLDQARGTDDEARVASDLGPKLLAALTALGMTPAGRGVQAKGGEPSASIASRLDEFTSRRLGKHAS